MFTEYPTTVLN